MEAPLSNTKPAFTDACVDWEGTIAMLGALAAIGVRPRNAKA